MGSTTCINSGYELVVLLAVIALMAWIFWLWFND